MTLLSTPTELTTYPTSIHDSPTLLPENLASFVTAASLAARLSLRCSSVFAEALFEAAKYGTVLSLGLSRHALTNALATAKRIHTLTYDKSPSEVEESGFLRVLEKYTSLGIYIVHNTFTLAELFALSGLQLTSQTVKSGLKTAEESVRIIDGIFGSNETSRAIASIITLVHRELTQDPEFELLAKSGKVAILAGLTKAMTAFAVLQYVTHKRMMKQVKVTALWDGLVPDDEDDKDDKSASQQPLIPFREPSPDVIYELEKVLVHGMDDDNDQQQITTRGSNNEPYGMYEVTTTTRYTTTTTTRIQPIDRNQHEQHRPKAKYVIVQAEEERQDTFMATVDGFQPTASSSQQPSSQQLVVAPSLSNSVSADTQLANEERGIKVMLSSISQKLTSQQIQRHERYGEPFSPDIEDTRSKRRPTCWNKRTVSDLYERHSRANGMTSFVRQRRSSTSSVVFPSITPLDNNDPSSIPRRRIYRSHSISNTISTITTTLHPTTSTSTTTTTATTSNPSASSSSSSSPPPPPPPNNSVIHYPSSDTLPPPSAALDASTFSRSHLIANIGRFMRYASAAYGESFMRILGIGNIPSVLPSSAHHPPNHHVFAHHTGVAIEDILLSSYTDRSPLLTMHHPSIHELVHYVTVDHAARAIVLTCRGTLGLSDVLTDLTCAYADVTIAGQEDEEFKAHGGMWDAAQMLAKQKGRVFQAIQEGLAMYPSYGLVLCGHSLGGGVASLVGVLWSEKKKENGQFVLSNASGLPAGRPIHCYVFGPPSVMSLDLSKYCSGLVTSVVHGYDIVSCLSLGLLKDFKNVAVSLHTESHVADEILSRIVSRYCKNGEASKQQEDKDKDDDDWFWALIKTMRADMRADKLYPPSTVYHIELISQLAPAPSSQKMHRVRLTRCDDLEARFSEIVFSRSMFIDHAPPMYEKAIRQLCRGFSGKDKAYENL
ncbi:hypothetical protein O0I10_012471 [Lichtheimia ornata]|uniref:sn-1-specific diacylglycerol lipase n=1 Tax=Lichtheimia ornata TaxID=688661 RepID=A0AAD7XT71_9FUNG|nr:uncharacterized protein O0I10_012471 [Lichtheimia ornata]KAJ8651951.1 hypothetical protein O0I10_012471 [Lichtheimia ornata]